MHDARNTPPARHPSRTVATGLALLLLLLALPAMAAQSGFTILVPEKPGLALTHLVVLVTVDNGSPITFEVLHGGATRTVGPLVPTGGLSMVDFVAGVAGVGDGEETDLVAVTPSGSLPAADPSARRSLYRFDISLESDYLGLEPPADCSSTLEPEGGVVPAGETWRIQVSGGADRIENVCLVSVDQSVPGNECVGLQRVVPAAEGVASLTDFPGTTPAP
ncbi:MAG: hypothetical protein MI919_36560, partial [Holophagales bacterium]|nr:hypothetical protein [Holophagales bacterium]